MSKSKVPPLKVGIPGAIVPNAERSSQRGEWAPVAREET